METKICKKCCKEKDISDFPKTFHKSRNYLYIHNVCNECYKLCKKEWDRAYRLKHKEELQQKRKENSEKYKEYCKNWHKNNIEKDKEYRKINKDKLDIKRKEWRNNNIEKSREWHKKYKRKVRQDDLIYAKDRIRNMISTSFRRKGYKKNSLTYLILGADYEYVWSYLKQTWKNNYGSDYNGEPYEIDHIIPLATAQTEEKVKKLCNYRNLQLLTPEDNLKKGKS